MLRHELRTPLTSLKTEIEVALRDKKLTAADAKKLLKSNLEDVNNMQGLSNYLLELNRYENSETPLEISKIDLAEVISHAIKKVEPIAAKNKIKIVAKLTKTNVSGNEDAVIELSTILIDNAIKYSGKSKTVEVRTKIEGLLKLRTSELEFRRRKFPIFLKDSTGPTFRGPRKKWTDMDWDSPSLNRLLTNLTGKSELKANLAKAQLSR